MKFKQYLIESGLDLLKPIDPSEIESREIEGIVDKIKSTKHTILSDDSYHIHDSLDLSKHNLKFLLDLPIKISKVDGSFYCSNNQLTSLEGAPTEVGGSFTCHSNKLTNLEGAPKEVGEFFWVNKNPGPNGNGFTEEDVKAVSNVKGKIIR
jgi:hypothetical protein